MREKENECLFLLVRCGGVKSLNHLTRAPRRNLVCNEHIGKLLMHKRTQCKLQRHALGLPLHLKAVKKRRS